MADFQAMATRGNARTARFCRNCRHAFYHPVYERVHCGHDAQRDASGEGTIAVLVARREGYECGPEGLLFMAKEADDG